MRFSAERTLLAWIRTALGIMAFGFVVARVDATTTSIWAGTSLLVLGAVINALAVFQYRNIVGQLDRHEKYIAPAWSMAIVVAMLLAAVSMGLAGWLAYTTVVWR
jgi:putative membrane protein